MLHEIGSLKTMQTLVRRWRLCVLVVFAASLLAGVAAAQAPPASFFAGRSNSELRDLASDPHNDVLLRRTAASRLVLSLTDAGDFDAVDAAAREFSRNIDPFAVKHVGAVRRRIRAHLASLVILAATLALAVISLVAGRRSLGKAVPAIRRIAPVTAFFFVYAGLVGGYLASRYENSSAVPFVLLAALMVPLVVILRAWSTVGSARLPARVGRGAVAVGATVALGFLVVEQVNPAFLEGFGL